MAFNYQLARIERSLDKIARLQAFEVANNRPGRLGIHYTRDDQVQPLAVAGYSDEEIASIIGLSEPYVRRIRKRCTED